MKCENCGYEHPVDRTIDFGRMATMVVFGGVVFGHGIGQCFSEFGQWLGVLIGAGLGGCIALYGRGNKRVNEDDLGGQQHRKEGQG